MRDRQAIRAVLAALCATLLAIGILGIGSCAPAMAAAETTHIFNATRSLTGDCSTSAPDEVPDPGCPGGTHPGGFTRPTSPAIDQHGDVYLADYGPTPGSSARVLVYSATGILLDEIAAPGTYEVAVDGEGHLYTYGNVEGGGEAFLDRYDPTAYEPAAEEIAYEDPPTRVLSEAFESGFFRRNGIAVDPSNGHLYVDIVHHIDEFGSATEGNPLLDNTIGQGVVELSVWVTVDGRNHDVYASSTEEPNGPPEIIVFDGEAPGYPLKRRITNTCTLAGEFGSPNAYVSPAIDEGNGHLFVDDIGTAAPKKPVYEFTEAGECVGKIEHDFAFAEPVSQIAFDNGAESPNKGYLYVPSAGSPGHLYAFEPLPEVGPPFFEPEAQSLLEVLSVGEGEAAFRAVLNPNAAATEYRFEIVSREEFEAGEFEAARVFGEGELPAGGEGIAISAGAEGLAPGTEYVVRAVATNEAGSGEVRARFTTFPATEPPPPCANAALRTGLSFALPDCRAYELVTPPDTNGHEPHGVGFGGDLFPTLESSPQGESVSFLTEGGPLPGFEGAGGLSGDAYLATRTAAGWRTAAAGPSGAESPVPVNGSPSPDHGYSFWEDGFAFNLPSYIRYPDGSSHLIGRGSLGTEPHANGDRITEGARHVIFNTRSFEGEPPLQLEPEAPPTGTMAIYDRTRDPETGAEETHVVSLLPGDVTPEAGEDAFYLGSSADGRGIAFKIGTDLYLRRDDAKSFHVASGSFEFASVSEGGGRITYLQGGDVFAFDAASEETTQLTATGDATVVNVSANGAWVCFVCPSVLTAEANPNGESPEEGANNLYLTDGSTVRFIGRVTNRDVEGEEHGGFRADGLGLWAYQEENRRGTIDPSRLSPDGSVLLFESRADLTAYEAEGKAEVYRYDGATLRCLSCNPTGLPPGAEASLESVAFSQGSGESLPFSGFAVVPNLSPQGNRAFFQSSEALVARDTDGVQDVYEWEEAGTGSCRRPGGCLFLITSGHSARPNFLYGVSASGDDVFFTTTDRLLPGTDASATRSIYDARVGGGFPEPQAEPCVGEGCLAPLSGPPPLVVPGSAFGTARHRCPRGKRRVVRHGHVRCLRRHHRHHRRHHHHRGKR